MQKHLTASHTMIQLSNDLLELEVLPKSEISSSALVWSHKSDDVCLEPFKSLGEFIYKMDEQSLHHVQITALLFQSCHSPPKVS